MSDEKKFLSESELFDVEVRQYEERLAQEEINKQNMKIEMCKLQLNLMSANYTLKNKELTELNLELKQKQSTLNGEKMRTKSVINNITETKKLKQKWGYNPLTGEINE